MLLPPHAAGHFLVSLLGKHVAPSDEFLGGYLQLSKAPNNICIQFIVPFFPLDPLVHHLAF